jgi:hypothetical protein
LFSANSSFGGASVSDTKEATVATANIIGTNATNDQKKSSPITTSSPKESASEIDQVAKTKERRTRRLASHVGQGKSGNFVCVTREPQFGHSSGWRVMGFAVLEVVLAGGHFDPPELYLYLFSQPEDNTC